MGMAPHQYLIARRIEKACHLLRSTELAAEEISHRVGFSSPSQFGTQFRKLVGTSPRRYRAPV